MPVLIVLIVSFLASLGLTKMIFGDWNYILSGNIAMCMMLLFTAFGHFKFPKGMAKMIPEPIPFKIELVYLTGLFEIAGGIALLFEQYRYIAGTLLILFFVFILPANIKAAFDKLDYQKGTYDGKGVSYLWFRIPMQLFLIWWIWEFDVKGIKLFY